MKYFAVTESDKYEIDIVEKGTRAQIMLEEILYEVDLQVINNNEKFSLLVNGESHEVVIERNNGGFRVTVGNETFPITILDEREAMSEEVLSAVTDSQEENVLSSTIPGIVTSVLVHEGETVEANQALLTVEAMKMENEVRAVMPGVVTEIFVQQGDTIGINQELVRIGPLEGPLM